MFSCILLCVWDIGTYILAQKDLFYLTCCVVVLNFLGPCSSGSQNPLEK